MFRLNIQFLVLTRSIPSCLTLKIIFKMKIKVILIGEHCSDDLMFGCVDSWLLYNLTGKHMTEVSYNKFK